MPFERFVRSTARADADAKWMSVQGNGSISVSFAAMKAIGMPDYVYLLHDREAKRIAVQTAGPESADAYRARPQGRADSKSGARVVSASAFFKHIGVNPKAASGRYDADVIDDMVVAKLPPDVFTGDK